ncbi:AraC family transcriptional regulator ligand-binding domain-containing protein [Shewanella sp. SP1S1-7]|uniref:AraC family transcriptional regulator ligand-binding domain-containing protein n=1 Tax=Shewanella sp. SP1S1-7 TaxID=3063536 RepID=UPI0028919328|nr:AraC family transcriptional regulator ligand-binding domain-containing protein [Shewanella sp. SP1S1-7]MDT3333817.1 AraC family transcriptional regulator ligand-binding domain-containing protein [Shewanella sp. SP1S1-7]
MRALATWQDKCIDSQLLVASLVGLFKQRGLDCDKLLRGTGIFSADIRKPGHSISPKQLLRLVDNGLSLWPSGDLSFLLGQLWLPSQSGALTAGMLCARDLNELGLFWYQFHWLTQPWLQCWRWQGDKEWHFLLSLDLGTQRHRQFFIELSLSSLVASCKQLMGQGWRGSMSFPYETPQNIAQYYKYFGTDISFDAPLCRVSMAKAFMQQPLLYAQQIASSVESQATRHAVTHAVISRQSHFQSPRYTLFASEYRLGLAAGIRLSLMRDNLSLPEMAEKLMMSPATLKRRLAEMDLSFGQLADETRLIKALYYLATPSQDANTIANSLSFSDASNFRRSFKRWTGQLPTYFRSWLA